MYLIVHGIESLASNPPSAMTEVGDAMGEEITSIDEAETEDTTAEELTACVVDSTEVDVADKMLEIDRVGVELTRLVEDTVAVGMLVETAPASDEDEGPITTIEDIVEVIGVEVAMLLVVSDDALDKAVDITGVVEEDGLAETVTT